MIVANEAQRTPVIRGRAVVLALSAIGRDPRVTRQCDALADDGWTVTSIGYGDVDPRERWTHVAIPEFAYEARIHRRLTRIGNLLATQINPYHAWITWRAEPRHRALVEAAAGIDCADVVVANDFVTLPAGIELARRLRATLIYDTHEYASGERIEHRAWRLLYPPYIRVLEWGAIAQGAIVMTVSEGIAAMLQRDYRLKNKPVVVRNMPRYSAQPYRPPSPAMLVHHHGSLSPGRGLEALLDSVPLWRDGLRLRIRGPGEAAYVASLKARAESLGVGGRVTIEPGLPLPRIIAGANDADIGIHLLPPFGDQNRFALPNKLFEYLMAGLAVVISDLPEMGDIVRSRDVGLCLPSLAPAAIADALNGMSVTQVARWKANALAAARDLCWDQEREMLQRACREKTADAPETASYAL